MTLLVNQLARLARKTLSKIHDKSFPETLAELRTLACQITSKDIGLDPELVANDAEWSAKSRTAPVTYIDIADFPSCTMGVFILKRGTCIPLHDHPGMYGIIKVVHGTIGIQSYSICDPPYDELPTSAEPREQLIPVKQLPLVTLNARSEACQLEPMKGNIHEVTAVSGPAAFLDILGPPYIDGIRDCHYYRQIHSVRDTIWLQEIPPPREFWSVSAPYEGPHIDV